MDERKTTQWIELFNQLEKLQTKIDDIDIITITGFFTTLEELEKHLKRYSS